MKTPVSPKARLLGAVICCLLTSPSTLAQNTEALDQLLEQADFWENNQRPDLARQILERYLQSQPDSPAVIYRLAVQALQEGRVNDAQRWTERLAQIAPDDPRLQELEQGQLEQALDGSTLARVRRLAQEGQIEEAMAGYQQLFRGSNPPRNLAPEYYQTLAGTEEGWPQARAALQGLHEAEPNDRALARALAEVLTYRESTRRDGIDRLAALAAAEGGRPSPAISSAWRQALEWLNATMADRRRYDSYLALHPNDSRIRQIFEERAVPGERALGYRHLEAGRLDRAEASFRSVLRLRPNDAEAEAGLGIVMLRRERFKDAANHLARAIELSPQQAQQWREAHHSATFYSRLGDVRQRASAGEREVALRDLAPLVQEPGEAGKAARLLEASILRELKHLDRAEDAYRRILQEDPDNVEAKLGLIEVLRGKERWVEASELAAQLPASEQQRLQDLSRSSALALRARAQSQPPGQAEATLRQAISIAPDEPWVRHDLARLLNQQGRRAEARSIVRPLEASTASAEQLYVAALIAAEQESWSDARALLERVSPRERSPAMAELLNSARQQEELARAMEQWRRGQTTAARATLDRLRATGPSPAMSGKIALALSDIGAQSEALYWVQQDLAAGTEKSPADYANHALVLARAGRTAESEALLAQLRSHPQLSATDRQALNEVSLGLTVLRADELREEGQLADAYKLLATQLLIAPDDEQLLAAMARLYDSDGRHNQAQEIYSYILKRNPDNTDLLQRSAEAALASGNLRLARQRLTELEKRKGAEPSVMLLSARLAHARGDNRRALTLLSGARQQLAEDTPSWEQNRLANPFRNKGSSSSDRPSWLPGSTAESASSQTARASNALEFQIAELDYEIRRERAREHQFGTNLQMRSGEKGLSELQHLSANLAFSGYVGNSQLMLEVTPTTIHSGTPRSNALWRFGYGALAVAPGTLNESLRDLGGILDEIDNVAQHYFDAQDRADLALLDPTLPNSEKQRLVAEAEAAQRVLERNLLRDPVYEAGMRLAELSQDQQLRLQSLFGPAIANLASLQLDASSRTAFANSRASLEAAVADLQAGLLARSSAASVDSQRDAGLGLQLSYGFDDLLLDIGSTPLGFERSNLVGGVAWHPSFGRFDLSAQLERRAVTESVLSYAGTRDPLTDEVWGGVVKSGLVLGLSYDSPRVGVYGELSGHRYSGKNVASNNGYQLAVGAYTRAIQSAERLLQLGVHIQGMSFDKNLGHFTFGHGGYFSPQDYLSIAYPINYQERRGRWEVSANLAPGYQNFSRDRVAYFPTDRESQAVLDIYSALGAIPSSYYAADDESGFGISLGGKARYRISPTFSAEVSLGYSNFGDYEDYHISLQLVSRFFK